MKSSNIKTALLLYLFQYLIFFVLMSHITDSQVTVTATISVPQSVNSTFQSLCLNDEWGKNYQPRTVDELPALLKEGENLFNISEGYATYIAPRDAYPRGFETWLVNEQVIVDVGYHLISKTNRQQTVRFIAILDSQQIPINNMDSQFPYHDVEMRAGESALLEITLPPLDPGIHDFIITGYPDIDSPPQLLGNLTEMMKLTQRMTLVVGEEMSATQPSYPYTLYPATGLLSDLKSYYLLHFSLDNTLLWWSHPEPALTIAPNETLDFNLMTGYLGSPPKSKTEKMALLLFNDYIQVPFSDEELTLYVEVDDDTSYTTIPVSLPIPEELGRHDITVVRITNPNVPRCVQFQDMLEASAHGTQVISDTVSIEVQK